MLVAAMVTENVRNSGLYVELKLKSKGNYDHLISPMSANIVETAMAMGIQWSEALGLLLRGSGVTGDYYAYLLESLIVISVACNHRRLWSTVDK
ncbi:Uncharacterized protein TCM_040202 [Theobroma cacao]|uniref:Uncharacterized protein n=1 Tax=Theobroma cacao TaxID=3641 RepID=A0A061GYT9_THECC|nr:Uncharacterized protein TCM_040202 [Theobroma cacao]